MCNSPVVALVVFRAGLRCFLAAGIDALMSMYSSASSSFSTLTSFSALTGDGVDSFRRRFAGGEAMASSMSGVAFVEGDA